MRALYRAIDVAPLLKACSNVVGLLPNYRAIGSRLVERGQLQAVTATGSSRRFVTAESIERLLVSVGAVVDAGAIVDVMQPTT